MLPLSGVCRYHGAMRTSIRTRMIVAMNLLVAAVGAAVGWMSIEVAGRGIERRLVDQPLVNVAGLVSRLRLEATDELMKQFSEILDAQFAAGPGEGRSLAAASLPEPARAQLDRMLADGRIPSNTFLDRNSYPGRPPRIALDGHSYYARSTSIPDRPGLSGPWQRLFILVPEAQLASAKKDAAWTIAGLTLAAVLAATLVASTVSLTISRPVRRLADRMDHIARQSDSAAPVDAEPAAQHEPAGRHGPPGPSEMVRLRRSFDALLARLAEARAQLARSARLATLGQMAASVAHELRNPLSGIKMNARVLADALGPTGSSDRSLELIVREIDRMDLYLQELLQLASVSENASDSGGQDAAACARLEDLDLARLAESVLQLIEGRCRHQSISIERRLDAAVPAARGQSSQIRGVMLNLMLNAADAMPHGGVMTLRLSRSDGGVRFAVTDTGKGVKLPPDEDLFDPFVTTKAGGTGLGLYISRQAVDRLGGRISYDSSDSGATFWFELPAAGVTP
ncbi:MAG: Adaptive-response sensory-kinase SasA [Phycisphaerae bacterium]|nr:Adaptive-response sensory-kinase SasA [Phycisphaerae bacterium]